jgi:WD40-like Beta Propeller Repeat
MEFLLVPRRCPHCVPSRKRASFLQIFVKLLRRRRARDLAIVAAVVALGAVALTDALRDQTTTDEGRDGRASTAATTDEREASMTTTEEPQDGQTPTTTTDEGEASVPRLPRGAASGLLAFTAPGACELRAVDLRSGRMLDLPRLETNCELYAPRVGTRVAYSVPDDWGTSKRHFSILDLENPRASFGDYLGDWNPSWSPDGSTLAWCDGRSGFELAGGQRPKRLDRCPWAYDPSGALASVNDRQEIVVGGRPLLRARRPVWQLAWGVDGSLAVLVEGGRLDRYEDGRLAGTASVTPPSNEHPATIWPPELAPDNCAALSVSGDVVRLIDLGCFQGRAPQTFKGVYADWSPNGKWIVVAEPDAIVFHRVVGREASVRRNVVAGQLAWLSG